MRIAIDEIFAQSPRYGYTVEEISMCKKAGDDEGGMSYLPEVLDDRVLLVVATVIGVLCPVVDIDFRDTTNEQLELTLIEDVDKV